MKRIFCFLIIILFFASSYLYSQDSTKRPPIKVTELGKNLYNLSVADCNIIVSSGNDGVLLVDASYKEFAKYTLEEIRKISDSPVEYIINTHWHFDHVGGNSKLKNDKTIIIAHEDAKNMLSKDQVLMGDTIKALPFDAQPNKTFVGSLDLNFNGEKIDIIPISGGHSAGDILVYFKNSNVMHIGDIIFADMFPYVDYEHGGSIFTLEKNIQYIIDMIPSDIKIVPGHGRVCSIDDLKKYREMIISTTNIVLKEKKNGKSIDEIKKANALKDWKNWEGAFTCNDWIEIIYNSK